MNENKKKNSFYSDRRDNGDIHVDEADLGLLPAEETRKSSGGNLGCLSSLTYVLMILGASVIISALAILGANDMFALVKPEREASVSIPENAGLREISKILKKNDIIRYPSLFWFFGEMTNMDSNFVSGELTLDASMDYRTLLSKLRKRTGGREIIKITIREGMTQDEILKQLSDEGICELWKLQAYAKYYNFNFSFIKPLPYSDKRLEGYLFPDTYEFYTNDNPVRVFNKFLSNFNRKLDVDMRARLENINMSLHEIVNIASMVEKEAKFDEERPTVSSVIHNRLRNSSFPYLQIDATVQYALPERKEQLSLKDLEFDSPYNTYKYKGLPAGPICNPGVAALRAALFPEDTSYYYYVARKNGWHYFSRTKAEHDRATVKAKNEVIEASTEETGIEG